MKKIIVLSIFLIFSSFVYGCNTIVGGVKGAGRDIKAVTVYTRDALTGNPISDENSD